MDEFRDVHLRHNEPVVYRGYAADSLAVRKWTPSYLQRTSGHLKVPLWDVTRGVGAKRSFTLVQFSDYLQSVKQYAAGQRKTPPAYLRSVFFIEHLQNLLADLPAVEFSSTNLLRHQAVQPYIYPRWNHWFELFVSAPGVRFPVVHHDTGGTHAWSAQIYGRKRMWLWPPDSNLRAKRRDFTAAPGKSLDTFFAGCEPTVIDLEPGDVVFIPSLWWHAAEALSTSITVSENWVSPDNWGLFVRLWLLERAKDGKERQAIRRMAQAVGERYHAPAPNPALLSTFVDEKTGVRFLDR